MKQDVVYIQHILEAVTDIKEYTAGGSAAFFSQKMVQDAVIRNLEIIGEAVKNISQQTRVNATDIPWSQIAGLRDVLIHHYFGVDLDTIWLVVENRLPVLEEQLKNLIRQS